MTAIERRLEEKHLDKHRMAHGELHQALHDVIDAMEMLEKLAVVDEGVRVELSRKLTRARMHLREARQDMRVSRLGDPNLVLPSI